MESEGLLCLDGGRDRLWLALRDLERVGDGRFRVGDSDDADSDCERDPCPDDREGRELPSRGPLPSVTLGRSVDMDPDACPYRWKDGLPSTSSSGLGLRLGVLLGLPLLMDILRAGFLGVEDASVADRAAERGREVG